VAEQLAGRGIRSVAVDLEGHGLRGPAPRAATARPFDAEAFATEPSPVGHVTASSAAALLAGQVRAIGGGRPCLVVAHSNGGVVATALAELAPELVAGLVYVAAIVPANGEPGSSYATCPENDSDKLFKLLAADPAVVGAARIDVGDPHRRDEIKAAFYADVDDRTADAAIALLSPDGPIGIPAAELTVTPERYGRIPHSYVICAQDNAIPPAVQHRLVKEIDAVSAAPTVVIELESSHSPFLSQLGALADVTAEALSNPSSPLKGLLGKHCEGDVAGLVLLDVQDLVVQEGGGLGFQEHLGTVVGAHHAVAVFGRGGHGEGQLRAFVLHALEGEPQPALFGALLCRQRGDRLGGGFGHGQHLSAFPSSRSGMR
jgi:pimeloyl-ACP methyl ester carboxylesterase